MKIVLFLSVFLLSSAWAKWNVTSYNIRNFDRDQTAGNTNITELTSIIKDFKSDVMAFVEVVNDAAFKKLISDTLPGYSYQLSTCGGFGNQKLAIAYNKKTFKFLSAQEDFSLSGEGNSCGSLRSALIVKLKNIASAKTYTFVAVHLKAGSEEAAMKARWEQYTKLSKIMKKYKAQNLVVMGDFNTTGYNVRDQDYTQFEKLLKSTGTATMSEDLQCTSYWEGVLENGQHQSSILDHIVIGTSLSTSVTDIFLGAHCAKADCQESTPSELGSSYASVSDHCPVQVNFR